MQKNMRENEESLHVRGELQRLRARNTFHTHACGGHKRLRTRSLRSVTSPDASSASSLNAPCLASFLCRVPMDALPEMADKRASRSRHALKTTPTLHARALMEVRSRLAPPGLCKPSAVLLSFKASKCRRCMKAAGARCARARQCTPRPKTEPQGC